MDKRYQVFVSSTYHDLHEERQEVMHALLELDCIPSGMELFPAANESQWSLIKKVIEDCDYYILIIGGRYGSLGSDGLSYTEMEFRYALQLNKPTIAFLHREPGKIASEKCEANQEGKSKLEAFRDLAQGKLCKFWTTPTELGSVVSRSLIQLIKNNPAIGWIRADEIPDKNATLELLKLRKQVDDLEAELTKSRMTAPKGTENLVQGDEPHLINYTFKARRAGEYSSTNWNSGYKISWNSIFASIAPLMIDEASEIKILSALSEFIGKQSLEDLRKDKRLLDQHLHEFSIKDEDFQTIKVQLRALGLIAQSNRSRSVKDKFSYWRLTPYGDELMTRLRAIHRTISDQSEDVTIPSKVSKKAQPQKKN